MVERLSPLLTDTSITNVVHDLPSGISLLSTLVDKLYHPEVRGILEEGGPIADNVSNCLTVCYIIINFNCLTIESFGKANNYI